LKVFFSGCVDVWDPKVIRSGAGAHFRLPIYASIDWEDIPKQLHKHTSIVIADSNAKLDVEADLRNSGDTEERALIPVSPYYGVDYTSLGHVSLIIGGETEGISEDSYR
jgi:tRNA G18 (ribose-2'-O)-methylase SpoU